MSAAIIDGKALSQKIQQELADTIQAHQAKPGLAVILVGDDPASTIYVQHKERACQQVGINSICYKLSHNATTQDIQAVIEGCNNDKDIHGILLQLPLPSGCHTNYLLECIDPKKDVDGFHPYNLGRLAQRRPQLRPCTPYGIRLLLDSLNIDISGKNATIIGASNIVGRPLALELLLAKCTVTVAHRYSTDLKNAIESADILISATGKRDLFPCKWIRQQAIVIDVGIHRLQDGTLSGDLDFLAAKQRAGHITPVPGGVGPMTVACLLLNTWQAYGLQNQSAENKS